MNEPHKLYYFGRTCLWIFLILFVEALVVPRLDLIPGGAPRVIQYYAWCIEFILPWLALPGMVASVGLMRRATWSRPLLSGLLWLGAIGCLLFVGAAEADAIRTGNLRFAIGAPWAGFVMVALIVTAARHVASEPFD